MTDVLEKLEFPEYFFIVREIFATERKVETLTEYFSNDQFTETTPYLTRRKLIPKDKRFSSIELVYEKPEEVQSIVWDIKFTISQLIQYFGTPKFHYMLHGSATSIGFIDKNNSFSGFESIHPECVSNFGNRYKIVIDDDNENIKIVSDLELNHISFKPKSS